MTREEKDIIFNRLFELEEQHPAFAENVRDNAYCEAITDVKRIIDGIKEHYSLPSNLDEAANTFGFKETLERLREGGITRKNEGMFRWQIEKAFKAGAEWMAGRFVLVGGEPTGWFRANDGSEYATGLDLEEPIKLPVDFYVRKK